MDSTRWFGRVKRWIAIYLGAVSCIWVPLFNRGTYFGLIKLKSRAYLYSAIPAVILMAVIVAAEWFAAPKKGSSEEKVQGLNPDVSMILLALIAIWPLISSLLSQDPMLSLMGTRGWSVGSLMIFVLVVSTIIVSQYFDFKSYMLLPVMAANVFINALAVIQSAGYDPFGLLRGIIDRERYSYLATMGNRNCYSGYLCLILPLFWGAYMSCKERATEVLYALFVTLGFMGVIMADSDSTFAGFGICLLFLLPFVFQCEQHMRRAASLLVMYGGCLLVVRYCPLFDAKTEGIAGVSKIMLGSPVPEMLCVTGILLCIFGGKIVEGNRGRLILIASEVILIALILSVTVYTVLHFNNDFGSGRGLIWRSSWEYFVKAPLRTKITGVGPEMQFLAYGDLFKYYGRRVATSHNEPLQILLAQGLVGIGLYIAFWGNLTAGFIRKKIWKKSTAVFFFPLATYWGQSLFCSVYPVTAVLFSFMAGAYLVGVRYETEGEESL